MPKDKLKTIYVCSQCGETSPRWLGRCPSCGAWNTMTEDVVAEPAKSSSGRAAAPVRVTGQTSLEPLKLKNISTTEEKSRIVTGIAELDRVLGGGIVLGSVILIGGEPGIGKSTILLQLCGEVSRTRSVLYVTGEESVRQIKLRAVRLDVPQDNISIVAESDVDEICGLIEQMKPDLVVIDSIQTMRCTDVASSSGTVSQVKESSARFLNVAKTNEIPTFIVGHVNKDGAIAGPKVMEHIVDTVLYFEGDKTLPYRVLRAVKNRYGSTNEIGMFDMTGKGLEQIENPSQVMLEGRPIGISGTCVACVMEGTRPVLSEIQALVTKTAFPSPRRTASGFDYNRMYLLLAVLEKRAGYVFGNQDVYINIIGGLKLDETACDLPVCLAMASSLLDLPVPEKTLAIGEVGLGGEVRSVPNLEQRLHEAERIGFERAVVPKHSLNHLNTKVNARFLCYDVQTYEQLRQNGHWDTCNVLFAASTMELGPADFPVVAVEDIITQRGLDKIKSGLSGYLTEEEFEHFKQNLVNQFSLENVVESLTILNASRVLSLVADMLEEMQRALGSHFQPKTVVGLNLHISCLIERLVKKEEIKSYRDLERFCEEHRDFVALARRCFANIAEQYRINLPDSEIGYIYDYISHDYSDESPWKNEF